MEKLDLIDPKTVWKEVEDLAEDLSEAGAENEKVAHAVAEFLDAVLPLDKLVHGALGELAEEADGKIFEEVVGAIIKLFEVDPEKQKERRSKRKERQKERRARRKERREDRAKRKEEKDSTDCD